MWPTYKASNLEKEEAAALAKAKQAKSKADSINIMEAFYNKHGEELASAKDNRLKLGLDLRGGMYVTMEVDIVKMLEESAVQESRDEIFEEVIKATHNEVKTSEEPTLDVFLRNFKKIAEPKGKSLISYFEIGNIKDATNEKIIADLRAKSNDAIEQAQEIIRQRIDKFGVSEPTIQLQGSNRVMVELPGVKDQAEMRKLLEATARLEFKLVRNNQDIVKAFKKIDDYLANKSSHNSAVPKVDSVKSDTNLAVAAKTEKVSDKKAKKSDLASAKDTTKVDTSRKDSAKNPNDPYAGLSKEAAAKKYMHDHQFTRLFATFFAPEKRNPQPVDYTTVEYPSGDYFFKIMRDSIPKLNEMLERHDIQQLIPFDLQLAVSAKGDNPNEGSKIKSKEVFDLYCLLKENQFKNGSKVTDANKNVDPTTNQWVVNMQMNDEGAENWARVTGANVGKRIAIVLDGKVFSAPNVINKITGGNSQITGMANAKEAHMLEIILKAGAMQAPVKIMEERVIGASLGDDSIAKGWTASGIAIALVFIFMLMYYAKGGLIANLAVIINVVMIITILTSLKGTLSMPGIAGIILTIGMAVDANILIFERVREELLRGKSNRAAIDEGFHKAMSAVIDTHVTTFITGLILYFMGSGFIQGFALTLMVGILTTLFTAILVSKAMINLTMPEGTSPYNFGQPTS